MPIKAWFIQNENLLKGVASFIIGFAGAIWVIFKLIYPDFVLPILKPGKLHTEIQGVQVGRTDQFTAHQLSFTLTNKGINRIYLANSYFFVKAHKITKTHNEKHKSLSVKGKDGVILNENTIKFLESMPRDKLLALRAQIANYKMVKKWEGLLAQDNLPGPVDLRSSFDYVENSFLIVHLGQLVGSNEYLDPGDTTSNKILVFVPGEYQSLEIISNTIFSKNKDVFAKYAFINVPNEKYGLLSIVLDKTKSIEDQLENLKMASKDNITNELYAKLVNELQEAKVLYDKKRIQIFIKQPTQKDLKKAQQIN